MPETLTTREAAKRLNVALSTVQTWVEQGHLKAFKTPGGHRKVLVSSVESLLSSGMAKRAIDLQQAFRILIVEDEAPLRELYAAHIDSWKLPIDLILAENGYSALLKAATTRPNLLIADLSMPEMDGFRMIQAIREERDTTKLPIIVVTGLSAEEIQDRGGLPPDVVVFPKPIPFQDLKQIIAAAVQRHGVFQP
jgi:excisionase family DNA binding protein